jgi:hypothetical protein
MTPAPFICLRTRLEPLGESPEGSWPPAFAGHRFIQLLPTLAVPFEMSMLQLHACALGPFGHESHLDLARLSPIGFDLPVRADVPADDHAGRRLVREDGSEKNWSNTPKNCLE